MVFQTDLLVFKVACPLPQYWTDEPSILCVNQWICNRHHQVISKYWLNSEYDSKWLTDKAKCFKISNFEHSNVNDIHIENIQYVSIHQLNSTTHIIYINIRWICATEQQSEHVARAYIVCIFIWRITVNSIEWCTFQWKCFKLWKPFNAPELTVKKCTNIIRPFCNVAVNESI